MHLHLTPVGGIAGDMFVGALIDARPALAADLEHQLGQLATETPIRIASPEYCDGSLKGRCFSLLENQSKRHDDHGHGHVHFASIRNLLRESLLDGSVRDVADAIFALLAEAEAAVHGVPVDSVAFHEVGNRDSIADIVASATLIVRLGIQSTSVTSLPLGGGQIDSSHGPLPVPAPAVVALLKGFTFHDDGRLGERVTPTGAAILRYLNPVTVTRSPPRVLQAVGTGFGTKKLEGMSNILRALLLTEAESGKTASADHVAVLEFEVDDQSGEDLGIGLGQIRALDGILDVVQQAAIGKKGRLVSSIRVLACCEILDRAIEACFRETTTLGVRHQIVERAVLDRRIFRVTHDDAEIGVKVAERPDGVLTAKAESMDLSRHGSGHAGRARLRRRVEEQAIGDKSE